MYQGTQLVITCTVTVVSAVDTGFRVNLEWSSAPPEAMNGTYVNVTDISGSEYEDSSTVTISPVDTTDSATYTCTASVAAADSDSVTSSTESSDTVDIAVESEKI